MSSMPAARQTTLGAARGGGLSASAPAAAAPSEGAAAAARHRRSGGRARRRAAPAPGPAPAAAAGAGARARHASGAATARARAAGGRGAWRARAEVAAAAMGVPRGGWEGVRAARSKPCCVCDVSVCLFAKETRRASSSHATRRARLPSICRLAWATTSAYIGMLLRKGAMISASLAYDTTIYFLS